jgi:hypothetical protein
MVDHGGLNEWGTLRLAYQREEDMFVEDWMKEQTPRTLMLTARYLNGFTLGTFLTGPMMIMFAGIAEDKELRSGIWARLGGMALVPLMFLAWVALGCAIVSDVGVTRWHKGIDAGSPVDSGRIAKTFLRSFVGPVWYGLLVLSGIAMLGLDGALASVLSFCAGLLFALIAYTMTGWK